MTILNTVQPFPWSQTYVAPENVRAETVHDPDGLKALAGSIRHFGRLLEPLKGYIDAEGRVAIWDGGRRHAALGLIAAEGDGVGAVIVERVDVYVTSQEEAAAASLATFVREDMHPADQFLAYNAKFDEGMTPDQIAAAFAVEAKTVSQLLRFRTLAPEVLEAFRAGRFGLDVCYAFTLTTDHDRQRALLDATGDKPFRVWDIKHALTANAVTARDKWARFIGREAYEAAGGTFLMDLFSDRQADEQWSNGDLVRELAQKKLREMEEGFLAEGWSKVIVSQDAYGWQAGYVAMKPEGPTKKGKARPFTPEQMAKGVVFIVIGYEEAEVKLGYEKVAKTADKDAPKPLAKAEPERFGWGHKGHHVMTQVATDATRVALMRRPDVGMDALATQLAWAVLRKPKYGSVADDLASRFVPEYRNGSAPAVTVEGMGDFEAAIAAWKARLPTSPVAFCDAVRALTTPEKHELMALCFAATLDADEAKFDGYVRKPGRWRHLGWMAREAGVDVVAAWTPDREFVSGGSKDALLAVNKGHGNRDWPESSKKGDLVAVVSDIAKNKGWRPEILATFMDVADPEPRGDAGATPHNEDEDRDARDEAEYVGWIAEAFMSDHGVMAEEAQRLAPLALQAERDRADGAEVGDDDYSWTRADAAGSASDYIAIQAENASADD